MSLNVKRVFKNNNIRFYTNYVYFNIKVRINIKIKNVLPSEKR
jgi:ABC-type long-subunit fatty acid transport system fused permease/ATPase subunit